MSGFLAFLKFLNKKKSVSYWIACLVGTLAVFFAGYLYGVASFIISLAALHPTYDMVVVPAVAVRFFGLGRAVLSYSERLISHNETFKLLQIIRVFVYELMEPAVLDYLNTQNRGKSLSLLISDVEILQDGILRVVYPVLIVLLTGISGGVIAEFFHPLLALVFLLFYFPILSVVIFFIFRMTKTKDIVKVEKKEQMYQKYIEISSGISDISSTSAEPIIKEQFETIVQKANQAQKQSAKVAALSDAIASLYLGSATVALLCIGAYLCVSGRIEWVYFTAVVIGFSYLFESASQLFLIPAKFEKVRKAAGNIFIELKQKKKEDLEGLDDLLNPMKVNVIQCQGLSFSYPNKRVLFQDVSFQLKKGSIIIVKGKSGAGKSTLIQLLLGFLSPQEGAVLADSIDLSGISLMKRRTLFSVADQIPYMFHGTIRENMFQENETSFGGNQDQRMMDVLKRVGLFQFVEGLPLGLDTQIYESGMNLSGGELQRLSIARALLRDAPFLLLDEPTAGLDAYHEQIIFQLILKVAEERGVLLITHRGNHSWKSIESDHILIKEVLV